MADVVPEFAVVRPRVLTDDGESRLLEDVVAEFAEERSTGVAWITGPPRSGKTTAINHLAAVFAHDNRFRFLDDATRSDARRCLGAFVISSCQSPPKDARLQWVLAEWREDELIEYVLHQHHNVCASVIERMGASRDSSWSPEIARIVLDRFAADPSASDPHEVLLEFLRDNLSNRQFRQAGRHCVASYFRTNPRYFVDQFAAHKLPPSTRGLLRDQRIRLAIASDHVINSLQQRWGWRMLKYGLEKLLLLAIAQRCHTNMGFVASLEGILASPKKSAAHAMAASILCAAGVDWKPSEYAEKLNLSGGFFGGVQWPGIRLSSAAIDCADFSSAVLDGADFTEASANRIVFVEASLRGALLPRLDACDADFTRANLHGANLTAADLSRAILCHADLSRAELIRAKVTDADLSGANLSHADLNVASLVGAKLSETDLRNADLQGARFGLADLRSAQLDGATMVLADLRGANLEDVDWADICLRGADLHGAHLTGSRLLVADLRGADLRGTGLGEIDWENADLRDSDLRGATFHMGSSRSGLVFSPIAREGSMTGFYTDDLEEAYFRPPEEIRKANLRRADLRGANIDGLDFYLVDLRGAKLDPDQLTQARETGAILSDSHAA